MIDPPGLATSVPGSPRAHLSDQKHQENHAEELGKRRAAEKQRKGKGKAPERSRTEVEASNPAESCSPPAPIRLPASICW